MAIDPSIIGNVMAPAVPQLPDVNAMMQTQTRGMEKMYGMERQREADAAAAQKEQQAAIAQAMMPSVAAAFSDPSDAGLAQAAQLMPPEVADAFAPFLDRLRSVPDVDLRKSLLRAELLKDDEGKLILQQLEPSANMRLQADTAAARAALDARRLALEEQKLMTGEQMTPYQQAQIELEQQKLARGAGQAGGATESERIAAYNAGRALAAAKRIANAVEQDPSATAPGAGEAFTNLFVDPNLIRSEERQRVSAAQREMIDALLTLATGAAYNREQLEGQMESYVPRWTDEAGTREDKRAALLDLIESAKIKAGRAWTPDMDAQFQALVEGPLAGKTETPAPSPRAAPQISSDEEYDDLPSGAEFIDPDGVRRRKP